MIGSDIGSQDLVRDSYDSPRGELAWASERSRMPMIIIRRGEFSIEYIWPGTRLKLHVRG